MYRYVQILENGILYRSRLIFDRNLYHFKSLSLLPEWHIIMGYQFENLVLNNRERIHQRLYLKSDEIINANPFFQHPSARQKGCQIDYMIQTKFGTLYAIYLRN